jgi:hypothetical protein
MSLAGPHYPKELSCQNWDLDCIIPGQPRQGSISWPPQKKGIAKELLCTSPI